MALHGPDGAGLDADADALGRAVLAAHSASPGDLIDELRRQFLELTRDDQDPEDDITVVCLDWVR